LLAQRELAMKLPFRNDRSFALGTYGDWPFKRTLRVARGLIKNHAHVQGITGSGKSRFLAGLYLSLYDAALPATLVDPHGDLAQLVLGKLIERGAFRDASAFDRIIYLDLPEAARRERYMRFNFLAQGTSPYTIDHAHLKIPRPAH
jgi:DNA helicase HerA-like ATPase